MVVGAFGVVLVGVLGAAGVAKLVGVAAFAGEVAQHRLVPARLVVPVARAVIAAELAAAVLLALPATRTAGAWLATALFAVFLAASARVLASGRTGVRCGCFGGGRGELATVGPPSVVRTAALLGLAAAVALGPPATVTATSVLLAGLVAVLVFLMSELTRLALLGPATPPGVVRP